MQLSWPLKTLAQINNEEAGPASANTPILYSIGPNLLEDLRMQLLGLSGDLDLQPMLRTLKGFLSFGVWIASSL